jgi:hypothetical protein
MLHRDAPSPPADCRDPHLNAHSSAESKGKKPGGRAQGRRLPDSTIFCRMKGALKAIRQHCQRREGKKGRLPETRSTTPLAEHA